MDANELNSAHQRAQAEADEWLEKHPEYKAGNNRLDTGESSEREVPLPLRFGGQRVLLSPNWQDGTIWPPHVAPNHALTEKVEKAMSAIKPKYADLLRRVYWERQTQEQIGKDLGISQQAVSQRIKTAERKLREVLG